MENQKPLLRAEDLSKRYEDGVLALDHLSLEVRGGEVYCLLGANGAGRDPARSLQPDLFRRRLLFIHET